MSRKARAIELVKVRFVQYDAPYQRGDVKVCSEGEAEKLVRNGVAEYEETVDAGD